MGRSALGPGLGETHGPSLGSGLLDAIVRLLALLVEELAALATMSVSSSHRHFQALTSMTPIQFRKQIRLHEARARLLAEPGDVAGVGFAVGYDSPSQFSREYRRMFGASPSRDALALREKAATPTLESPRK